MKRFALVLTALALVGAASAQTLKVGSPAPPIKVATWLKGKPVKIEKGKTYVVEFWATWCGPCRDTIPHLTELAKKYKGKVTFVGVSVGEASPKEWGPATIKNVSNFVKEMGPKMDYNVAMDGKEGTMSKTWMQAAKVQYIPWAFVVKKGKIAWIGSAQEVGQHLK